MKTIPQLYNTSVYSFLESIIKIEDLVKKTKDAGLSAVVLTDHNNMFALGQFLQECKKVNIKPVLGVDLDVQDLRFILLAKNYAGFQFINELILKKSMKEVINYDDLNNNNIFIIGHPEIDYSLFEELKISKENNFYLPFREVAGIRNINKFVYLKTNNAFKIEDNEALELLEKLSKNKIKKIENNYFENLSLPAQIIKNIEYILDNCNVIFPEKKLNLANYDNQNDIQAFETFKNLLKNAILQKNHELIKYKNWNLRLKYEVEIIKNARFINYFLIIQDIVNWAKKQNISIGPGRGSAAGSLVSYLLGITNINPLEYDLLFERFLNPGRLSWPDIDIDIQDDRRHEVFNYIKEKYGFEKVALISTFQTIGAKMALRDVARIIDNPLSMVEINKITKTLDANLSLQESYANNRNFRLLIDKYPKLFELALKIEGLPRQYSFHPAGIIIAQNKISNFCPVSLNNDDSFQQVQLTMNHIEDFGLLKIDLLGLKTLTEIANIENFLQPDQYYENLLKNDASLINDKLTFDMLNSGFTKGIFQLESPGMTNTINRVHIDKFNDLFDIISLFRPGPVKYINEYALSKKNMKNMKNIHPLYDVIVEQTYGVIVYQEQIMQIAQQVADFTFIEADFLRKAISKKHEDEILIYKEKFITNAIKKGLKVKQANEIYENIQRFGLYGFNKSHAVSYAFLTMKMAYYKARYPLYYYASLITNSQGSQELISNFAQEAKEMGFTIYSPDIRYSTNKSEIINNILYLPLNLIKGFGNESINKILSDLNINGPFNNNILEILLRLRFAGIKDAALDLLIKANVFRFFGPTKYIEQAALQIKDIYLLFSKNETFKQVQDKLEKAGYLNLDMLDNDFKKYEDIDYETNNEITLLGQSYNIFLTSKYENTFTNRLVTLTPGSEEKTYVVEVVNIKLFRTNKFFTLEVRDSSKSLTFVLSDIYYNHYNNLKKGDVILINAYHKLNNKNPQILNWRSV
ncbi:DNA polymerase III subunit alpha [Mycoplasma sp. 1018B]|uniref:DNA polymerase III subunit alpha n=1 Tax=Mycoplasma sp. 1018B TaxID=2967302 RepID=UPI00211C458A|nr:DNA polymerase III subunit alpha [Mycoplasma sp. 1018B]UUM19060.1 DNA polymerase III subunit alpha [Mycoplasma sp. 1018B]